MGLVEELDRVKYNESQRGVIPNTSLYGFISSTRRETASEQSLSGSEACFDDYVSPEYH